VRSTILRLRGIDSMQAFFERQRALMEQEERANSGSLGQQQEKKAQTGEIAARLSAHQSRGALPQEGSV
jgi:hypothetical protein